MDGHYPHPKITYKAYQLHILVSSYLTVNIEESKLVVLIVVTHDRCAPSFSFKAGWCASGYVFLNISSLDTDDLYGCLEFQ